MKVARLPESSIASVQAEVILDSESRATADEAANQGIPRSRFGLLSEPPTPWEPLKVARLSRACHYPSFKRCVCICLFREVIVVVELALLLAIGRDLIVVIREEEFNVEP